MTRAMRLRQPTSRGNSALSTFEMPAPGPGVIRVRLRAGPLNFRDTLAVGGGIRPALDRSFALEELADPFGHLQSGQHVGKVRVDM